jgi:hypothetical protein
MYKIIISCFLLIISLNTNIVYGATLTPTHVQECINKIQQLPEAKEMMENIQNEGPVRIAISHHPLAQQFGAYWDVDQRMICVCPTFHTSMGRMIGSILFEMHNAYHDSEINHYYDLASEGKIERESYIRSIEHLEYLNSKSTAAMAERGIELGIFPPETKRNTYANFEEHYYYQQYGGHSAWIGRSYDSLAPKGSVAVNRTNRNSNAG